MRSAVALLIVLLTVACSGASGASSVSAAVDAYLAALNARDPAALRQLAPPDFDAEVAIAEKLDKYAGVDLASLRRSYFPHSVTPNIVEVAIRAEMPPFEDLISIQRFGRSWYVVIGRMRGFTPGPTTGTRPPAPYDSPRDDRRFR